MKITLLIPLCLVPLAPLAAAQAIPTATTCAVSPAATDQWPEWNPGTKFATPVKQALERFKAQPSEWKTYVTPGGHTWNGDYLGFSGQGVVERWDYISLDKEDIPVVKYKGVYYRNPNTIAQNALKYYGRYLKDRQEVNKTTFLKHVDAMLAQQDGRGAMVMPYPYKAPRNFTEYAKGWVSAMSQGQAMSVFARAYDLTKDEKYLTAGRKALAFLSLPVTRGGSVSSLGNIDPSLGRYLWFEEYPQDKESKPSHVFNGHVFTVLGLYDWSQVDKTSTGRTAERLFRCGAYSLERALPYFELGGYSAYDLGHLTDGLVAPRIQLIQYPYQTVHIYQLLALYSLTKKPVYLEWANRFSHDLGQGDVSIPQP
ncbi:D-glucuronyl C5-epimerase family protein [Deinococcus fonticola]|uniref:D-glucuronyl C5-epimerase family protein n=1 Tax=Deinococcus fonticola TaxID=2528713 RepID=UPI001074CD53|nr:D-glucuronyl C5-epimerase family protein [Deinococcus fonticola]